MPEVTTPTCARPTWTAVAMADRIVRCNVEPHQPVPRVVAPLDQRLAPDEILRLAVERHGEADAGLERIGRIGEFVIGEDQPRLDAHHVERLEAHRREAERLAGGRHRVEHRNRIARVAEDLITELAV